MAKKKKTEGTRIGVSTRGRTFQGKVVSSKMQKTVTVEWERRVFVPKYERYQFKRSRVKAHVPSQFTINDGDEVVIKECRPISKTKKFVVTEVVNK